MIDVLLLFQFDPALAQYWTVVLTPVTVVPLTSCPRSEEKKNFSLLLTKKLFEINFGKMDRGSLFYDRENLIVASGSID